MPHNPNCRCPVCHPEEFAHMALSFEERAKHYERENAKLMSRRATERRDITPVAHSAPRDTNVPRDVAPANPYASLLDKRPVPEMDPDYSPYGKSPDGYAIAVTIREVLKEKQ